MVLDQLVDYDVIILPECRLHCKGISSVKVTGGNKGVGYSVVKKLLKKFRGVVYLTGW